MSDIKPPPSNSKEVYKSKSGFSTYRFVVAVLVVSIVFSQAMSFLSVSPLIPLIIEEYKISHAMAGLLSAITVLSQVTFAIPASMLIGRIGVKMVIVFGCLLSLAPTLSFLAESFVILLFLRLLLGLGAALIIPAIPPLFMQWFKPKEFPLVNGMLMAALGLGVAFSNFIVVPISEVIGWKGSLSVLGIPMLVSMILWVIFGKTRTEFVETGSHISFTGVWRVLKSRNSILLAIADAGPYSLYVVALAWLPAFYNEVHDISLETGGRLTGIISLAGVVSLILAGLLSIRFVKRRPFFIFPGILIGFSGMSTFLLADTSMIMIVLALISLGFASFFYVPSLLTVPMELPQISHSQVSVTIAVIMTLGGISAFLAPLIVGVFKDLTGDYVPGLLIFSVLSWSLAVAGYFLPETGKN